MTLAPATDAKWAIMIRCSVWGSTAQVTLSSVPSGDYDVYLYVWEDNSSTTYNIALEGQTVRSNYVSGSAGSWAKLGPWPATITDGTIVVSTSGDANLSGIEVWRRSGAGGQSVGPLGASNEGGLAGEQGSAPFAKAL